MSRVSPASRSEISECVRRSLDRYFKDLDGEKPCAIYDMVLHNIERPMLEVVMREADGNQTVAADMLGSNRNTLRHKLVEHKLL
jgi:Fis family transcriptional regulator